MEHFELQADEKVMCDAQFEVLNSARKRLTVCGDLFYAVEVKQLIFFCLLYLS